MEKQLVILGLLIGGGIFAFKHFARRTNGSFDQFGKPERPGTTTQENGVTENVPAIDMTKAMFVSTQYLVRDGLTKYFVFFFNADGSDKGYELLTPKEIAELREQGFIEVYKTV